MKRKSVFFDLDGTLTDPAQGITNSVAYALERFGIRISDRRSLLPYIGPPLLDSFMRFHGLKEEDAEKAIGIYREYFADRGIFENEVYPGMGEFLDRLEKEGMSLYVATSKPRVYACRILEHFGLDHCFGDVFGIALDGERESKADVIGRALDTLGLRGRESDCLMVGDRMHDVQGAAAQGLDAVGVLYGYGNREELENAGARAVAADLPGLERILTSWNRDGKF